MEWPVRVLVLSCAVLSACSVKEQERKSSSTIPVKTEVFGASVAAQEIDYSATIQAVRSIPLSFPLMGKVVDVRVQEGDVVFAGRVLAVLDSSSSRDAWNLARAKLRQAEDAYARLKPMHDSGAVAPIQFVEAETGLEQARASEALARRNVDDCTLRAPASGTVVRKRIEPGMNTTPATPVLELVDLSTVDAILSIPENEVARIRTGMPVAIAVPGLADRAYSGKVGEVTLRAEALSRSFVAKVRIQNGDGALRLGMACRARVALAQDSASEPVLPVSAVSQASDGSRFVYVVDDSNRVHSRTVELAGFLGDGLRVKTGISRGDRIVVEGTSRLADGARVAP